ncbi:Undecaprenyl-diphosphatase [bioreactor metagenome]|uniref:Undecaprenyl-diphosphatase n=1 Tax=bioreactor metagenome TaxID=1076179 RepID=A0A644XKI7_9ZZZZ|nr:undecaprenyl-diphosphate phosphatase [Oscillospiraceae bacterium]
MIINILESILFGIVQGITEWLPISSTGHLIILEQFMKMDVSTGFTEMYRVVIQFGSILAVLVLYFKTLNPFSASKTRIERKNTYSLWFKVLVASVPAGIIGVLFDDKIDAVFYNYITVSITLILYGIFFILAERGNRNHNYRDKFSSTLNIDYKTAALIGIFQMLALIPGTSRSGATILGAVLLGCSRTAAAEFSFFLAIPAMFGASLLKIAKFGFDFSTQEAFLLIIGMITAFAVSLAVIRFLIGFVKKHSFSCFGWYRIILGAIVMLYFLFV